MKSKPPTPAAPVRRSGWALLWPVLGVGILVVSCVLLSPRRHFWLDELLTYYPATDPSLSHLLQVQKDLINSAPPLYFVLTWLWVHVFGASEISLRLFSSAGFSAAFVILWFTLRRIYGAWPAAFGLLACFTSSSLVFTHNAEARSYGLLAAELACAFALYSRLTNPGSPRPARWPLCVANIAVHAALVLTHYVAFFYSAAFFAALLFSQALRRCLDGRTLATIPLGWLAFLPWIPAFIHHGEFSRPHGWMTTPLLEDLLRSFDLSLAYPAILGFAVIALWLAFSNLPRRGAVPAELRPDAEDPTPFLILAFYLLFVPITLWAYSRFATPIFLDRYFYLAFISWAILLAHAAWRLDELAAGAGNAAVPFARYLPHVPRLAFGLILVLFLITFLANAASFDDPLADITVTPPAPFDKLPIVVENAHQYLPRFFYSAKPSQYVYLLDWETVTDLGALRGAVNEYQILEALRRQYPGFTVEDSAEFLAQHKEFLVIHVPTYHWLDRRLRNNPAYTITSIPGPKVTFLHVAAKAP